MPAQGRDLLTAAVGDGLFVFDAHHVRAHGLNRTAAAVFAACDGSTPLAAIAGALADLSGARHGTVLGDVLAVTERLAREGLIDLDGTPHPDAPRPPRDRFPTVPHTGDPAPAALGSIPWEHESATFAGLDVTFRFRTNHPGLGAYLDRVLAPLLLGADRDLGHDGDQDAAHTYAIVVDHDDPELRRLLALDGHVVSRFTNDASLAAYVGWHVNQLVSTGSTVGLQLHASCAASRGAAVALAGPMNAGKSTLVTGLVRAGWGYLTDETVAVGEDLLAAPYPKSIGLDPGSWPLFEDLDPIVPADERFAHRKWYVDPRSIRAGAIEPPTPLAAVVLVAFDASRPTALDPVDPLTAAVELARNSFNLATLGREGVERVVTIASTIPVVRMSMADLPSAIDTLGRRFAAPTDPRG